jgi:predicted acylesterase/phospholipase RssA
VWRLSRCEWLVAALVRRLNGPHAVLDALKELDVAITAVVDTCARMVLASVPEHVNAVVHMQGAAAGLVRTSDLIIKRLGVLRDQILQSATQWDKGAEGDAEWQVPVNDIPLGYAVGAAVDSAREVRDDVSAAVTTTKRRFANLIRAVAQPRSAPHSTLASVVKHATAALEDSSPDAQLISEALHRWYTNLPADQRVEAEDLTANDLSFRCSGKDVPLRILFGVPEIEEEISTMPGAQIKLSIDAMVRGLLSGVEWKTHCGHLGDLQLLTTPEARLVPMPEVGIALVVDEAADGSAVDRGLGQRALTIRAVNDQARRELQRNYTAVAQYAYECMEAMRCIQDDVRRIAAENIHNKMMEGGGGAQCPEAWAGLRAAMDSLAVVFFHTGTLQKKNLEIVAHTTVRVDEALAHLDSFEALSDTSRGAVLHSVNQQQETDAEFQRCHVRVVQERLDKAAIRFNRMRAADSGGGGGGGGADGARALAVADNASFSSPGKSFAFSTTSLLVPLESTEAAALPRGLGAGARPAMAHVQQGRKKVVMCLCGGGVRGVVSALIVQRLDAIVQAKYHTSGKRRTRLWDVVDEFIGTSTGAIVAVLLAIGTNPAMIVKGYEENSDMIFQRKRYAGVTAKGISAPKYAPEGRQEFAKRYVGRKNMGDAAVYPGIARPRVLTCDLSNLHTRVWTHEDDVTMTDAMMAATAAPTFFPAHLIDNKYFCDAGLAENHPGLEVVKDVHNVEFVVTVGTGESTQDMSFLANAGLMQWGPHIVDVLIDSTQRAAFDLLLSCFGEANSRMLNVQLPAGEKMGLDDVSTVPRLVDMTNQYMDENEAELHYIVDSMYRVTHPGAGDSGKFE